MFYQMHSLEGIMRTTCSSTFVPGRTVGLVPGYSAKVLLQAFHSGCVIGIGGRDILNSEISSFGSLSCLFNGSKSFGKLTFDKQQ